MLKILSACTQELDDPDKAVRDILDMLDLKNSLLKNSAALLFCQVKFIEAGIMERVCTSLPFDVIGCTAMYFGLPGAIGESMLTLTVLTSDDVEFASGICEPLTEENTADAITRSYHTAAAPLGGTADVIFAIPPIIYGLSVDLMIAALDSACSGLPIFGAVALDMDKHLRNPHTIYKAAGKTIACNDRMPLLLCKGAVKPKFFSVHFPASSVLTQDAIITEAEGPRLISINHEPAAAFLRGLGVLHGENDDFTHAMPLVIEGTDNAGSDVIIMQEIYKDGVILCSRQVPLGGIVNIGAITKSQVLDGMASLIHDITKAGDGSGLFIVSCFLRSIVMGGSPLAEIELLQQRLAGSAWLYISSGGELCPKYTEPAGKIDNQALQYALVACQL